MSQPGKVWFVGAGPGAADLLTVRATRLLAQAEIVLHDALMTDEMLQWAPQALHVAVGKRCDGQTTAQSEIDRALVQAARRHVMVIRLKGGDPAVFGRLDEEIDALDAAGIEWEIVPGVTAASAAAAAAGHSLTRRGVARRLQIITPRIGRGEDDAQTHAWDCNLQPTDTVVLYMAGRIARDCAARLLARGFAAHTPVVAVRAVSWPGQQIERMTLAQLSRIGLPVDERPVVLLAGLALARNDEVRAVLQACRRSASARACAAVEPVYNGVRTAFPETL